MNPVFNLQSIYVANIIGIVLIAVIIICNLWRLQSRDPSNRSLLIMMFVALTSCIADPVSYTMKGLPGTLPRIIVYATSTWLFAANMLATCCWVKFIAYYLKGGMSKKTSFAMNTVVAIGLLFLSINLFKPIVFSIDQNNLYTRTALYYYYVVIDYLLVINSIFSYYKSKREGGMLKFFPIWIYIVPIIIGGVVQSAFYGISVIPTSIAIATDSVISGTIAA